MLPKTFDSVQQLSGNCPKSSCQEGFHKGFWQFLKGLEKSSKVDILTIDDIESAHAPLGVPDAVSYDTCE